MALLDGKTLRGVKKAVDRHCANYVNGACLLTDSPCDYFTAYGADISCDYFEQAVLPNEPVLEQRYKDLHGIISGEDSVSKCVRCGRGYVKNSNRQKYCKDCKVSKQREHARNYQRKKQG